MSLVLVLLILDEEKNYKAVGVEWSIGSMVSDGVGGPGFDSHQNCNFFEPLISLLSDHRL